MRAFPQASETVSLVHLPVHFRRSWGKGSLWWVVPSGADPFSSLWCSRFYLFDLSLGLSPSNVGFWTALIYIYIYFSVNKFFHQADSHNVGAPEDSLCDVSVSSLFRFILRKSNTRTKRLYRGKIYRESCRKITDYLLGWSSGLQSMQPNR